MRLLLAAPWPWLLMLTLLVSSQAASSGATTHGGGVGGTEWQVLTRTNFSSQIRLHPRLLLLITMPWYGESRSLMMDIKYLVATDEQEFGPLKLMVVYRNSEKILADMIGATEGIKFIYYQRSVPFKYDGKLRAQAILSSVRYIMSLKHELAPFEVLHTKEDVEAFVKSTDKSVVLAEFCGWFTKLAHSRSKGNHEGPPSPKNHSKDVDIVGKTLTRESDVALELVVEDEELTFGVQGQLSGSPWKGGFTLANESISYQTEKNGGSGMSCPAEEFHEFDIFYTKLTTIAREYFLTPEKLKFGLVTERSSLNSLDVGNLGTWSLTIHYSGCANCSVIAKERNDFRSLLQSDLDLNIKEIDADASNVEPIFPANRPSVILFVDRLSESPKVRDESKLSLEVFREYVHNNYPSRNAAGGLSSGYFGRFSEVHSVARSKGISEPANDQTRVNTLAPQFMKVGDNTAVMVVNDGGRISYKNTARGSFGSPLYDILTKLLHQTKPAQRTKKTRISLVAKDVGFQLLSDDFEVQVVDSLPTPKSSDGMSDDTVANKVGVSVDANEVSVDECKVLKPEYARDVNDDTSEVSVDERKVPEPEYADDGQTSYVLGKAPTNYAYVNNSDLTDFSDTKIVHEGRKTEISETRHDQQLQEKVFVDDYSRNEIRDRLHKEMNIVMDAFNSLESGGSTGIVKQEKSGSLNWQDEQSFKQGEEAKENEEHADEYYFININSRPDESTDESNPHSMFSSSMIPPDDIVAYKAPMTSSRSSDDQLFAGSFFFSDGGYRFLRTLTGGSRIPSLVILDPVQQTHYVFPEEIEFSYSSLANFFDSFMNRTLAPYYRSSSSVISSKEFPKPPFVNLDFHEANSIPQLTTGTFCELVAGFEGCEFENGTSVSNSENFTSAWKMDVLVLFGNSWCGFCQRAELIVREVYRAFKSFMISSNCQSRNMHSLQMEEKNEESTRNGVPAIYLMDCVSNDCYPFLQAAGKDELYPTLLLFPAENKSAIAYEGGMSVVNIIEFLVSHGSNSWRLEKQKGFLWKKRTAMQHDAPLATPFQIHDKHARIVDSYASSRSDSHEVHVVAGSILTATDKLVNAAPFDNATVLIVLADPQEGFQGMIINKRISWDVFKNLDSTMEPVRNAPLFYGGPVIVQGYPLVSLSRIAVEEYTQVVRGVYYGNTIATSRLIERIKAGDQTAEELWFFLGYSGWGYAQMFDELTEGAWHVSENPIEGLDWPES